MTKRIKDIEDHLERSEARFERLIKIEAICEWEKKRERIIKLCVGSLAVGSAVYAVYMQF